MSDQASSRPRRRRLLGATVGTGTLVLLSCTLFPGCNLLPPPPCDDAGGRGCPREAADAPPDTADDAPADDAK